MHHLSTSRAAPPPADDDPAADTDRPGDDWLGFLQMLSLSLASTVAFFGCVGAFAYYLWHGR